MKIEDFSMNLFSLAGKVALVTGGNTGLGQAFALALAKAGADVYVTTRKDSVEETRRLVEAEGRRYAHHVGDLSEDGAVDQVIDGCLKTYGKLDILVNNAGTIKRAPLLDHPEADFDLVLEVNTKIPFLLSQKAARIMKEQGGGKIINVASMLSFQGGKFVPGYTASKHALAGLTKSFANELAPFNIQINAIAPGYFETNNTQAIRADEERSREILGRIPAQRWGTPYDLMGAVVFLASEASSYMNGHVLAVDGGWLVR